MDKLTEAASPYTQLTKEIRAFKSDVEALKEESKKVQGDACDALAAATIIIEQTEKILEKITCIKKDRRASKYGSIFFFSIGAIVQTVIYFKVLKIDENSKIVSFIVELFKLAGWQ